MPDFNGKRKNRITSKNGVAEATPFSLAELFVAVVQVGALHGAGGQFTEQAQGALLVLSGFGGPGGPAGGENGVDFL